MTHEDRGTSQTYESWLGRSERCLFEVDPWPAQALAAALGRDRLPEPSDALPPFWHHLYGQKPVAAADTGIDGHPARGAFLPPVDLPRRMWAGGRLVIERPLRLGDTVERISTVRKIEAKEGRSGRLVFVLVEHRFTDGRGLLQVEEHDIVYRGEGRPGEPRAAPDEAAAASEWRPDPVLLFRYSALTYNGHRIHYDADYVRSVEGYPGLVVHGPLLATLLLELARAVAPRRALRSFSFQALAPAYAGESISANAGPLEDARLDLWIARAGRLLMRAEVGF